MIWQIVAITIIALWGVAVIATIGCVSFYVCGDRKGNEMDQYDWYRFGVENGYCSEYVCDTHDGIPMSEEEMVSWDEGNDDCYWIVRLFEMEGKEDE